MKINQLIIIIITASTYLLSECGSFEYSLGTEGRCPPTSWCGSTDCRCVLSGL